MKLISSLFCISIFFSQVVWALDCNKIALEKYPEIATACKGITDPLAKTDCGMKFVEQDLQNCVAITNDKDRSKCIDSEIKKLKASWPAECIQQHRTGIDTRIEAKEGEKYGKSSFQKGKEAQAASKASKPKEEKNTP